MRAHAARMRGIAAALGSAQSTMAAAAALPGQEGPRADQARGRLQHERAMLDQRVHDIGSLASYLESQAGALEAAQRAWRGRFDRHVLGIEAGLVRVALS